MRGMERHGFGPDDVAGDEEKAIPVNQALGWKRRRWEIGAYGLLLALALGTRLWDVGGRTLHYDELLHAWYSWVYSNGLGYDHTPLTHGPFLFHAAAGSFLLMGASDVTARLLPALFGIVLVGLPWFLRRELGRFGSVATAMFLLFSPTILYFSRFMRNDIYMAVWAVLLVIIMWRYIAEPRRLLLFGWVAVWALAFTTKETTYFLAVIFGLALFWLSAPHYWRWAQGRTTLAAVPPSGALLLVLTTVTLPLWAPLSGLLQRLAGVILVNPDPNDPRLIGEEVFRAATETGAPAGGALYIAFFLVMLLAVVGVVVGASWDRKLWPCLAITFAAIWLLFFTSLFTRWEGFFTGLWGSLGYWMAQHPVERASQPSYYYFLGLAGYEFLIVIPALAGSVYLLFKGSSFDRFIVYWAAMSAALAIYAGEKMPWLLVGIAVPFALVAGKGVGQLVDSVRRTLLQSPGERHWLRWARSPMMAAFGAGPLFLCLGVFAIMRVVRDTGFLGTFAFWAALIGAILVFAGWVRIASVTPSRAPAGLAALGALFVLLVFSSVVGARVSYSYASYERPNELLVYSQTGQETSYAFECIERIAAGTGLGRSIKILAGESDNFAWQWRWYLRDYTNAEYGFFNEATLPELVGADVVLLSQTVVKRNQSQLSRFTRVGDLHHLWWFPNSAYADLTIKKLARGLVGREGWRTATDFFFSRKIESNPYRAKGAVYVSEQYAHLAENCTTLRATPGG